MIQISADRFSLAAIEKSIDWRALGFFFFVPSIAAASAHAAALRHSGGGGMDFL